MGCATSAEETETHGWIDLKNDTAKDTTWWIYTNSAAGGTDRLLDSSLLFATKTKTCEVGIYNEKVWIKVQSEGKERTKLVKTRKEYKISFLLK